jgi:phosphoglucosamine mutase
LGDLFGTDGIRGKANAFPMDCETAVRAGRAIVTVLGGREKPPPVIIGQDTRLSGNMLAHALAAGVSSAGGTARMAGVVPTPAVAVLAAGSPAVAGVVISASHNPFYDNGIKVFGPDGYKLSEDTENAIEAKITGEGTRSTKQVTGTIDALSDAGERYRDFLCRAMPPGFRLDGLKIVLDCANGAAWHVAPKLFCDLGADVTAISASPDGRNINDNCGSQHPEALMRAVGDAGASLGLAFDGDADRLVAVDENGQVKTGDQLIAIFANHMKSRGKLENNRVVTTVMSNLGLGRALKALGVDHRVSAVGDRHVMADMKATGAVLGGEDSGHLIFLDHHTTGDGIYAALRLCEIVRSVGAPLSDLSGIMTVYPQSLLAVDVKNKPDLNGMEEIQNAIRSVETDLGENGRVLVRYSGTQPVCRVMVEGPTEEQTGRCCRRIAVAVQRCLGG